MAYCRDEQDFDIRMAAGEARDEQQREDQLEDLRFGDGAELLARIGARISAAIDAGQKELANLCPDLDPKELREWIEDISFDHARYAHDLLAEANEPGAAYHKIRAARAFNDEMTKIAGGAA